MEAVSAVDNCIKVLQSYRDKFFDGIFNRVEEKLGRSVLSPRLTGRQRHRSNHQVATSRDCYRVAVFLPYLDSCLSQLKERFMSHRACGQLLGSLLPSVCLARTFDGVREAVQMYASFLDCGVGDVESQFMCWQSHWWRQKESDRPSRVLDALREARTVGTFPAIVTLLHIFATLPMTTASA